MNRLIPAVALALGSIALAHADDCRHSAERSAVADAAGITKVVIGAGAGDLKVRGAPAASRIQASGHACASNDDLLAKIQIDSRREGDTLYLKTLMPDLEDGSFLFNAYARLDLSVQVPDTVAIELEDSSGDLELSRVKSAVVADSSGDIEIRDIAGDLDVSDSSGDIEIDRVAGNLRVKDSSGDMEIEEIQGQVEIPIDSSGDISITQAGSVHIHQDSSGGIVIRRVNRDVRIDTDSSGDIDVAEVGGNFSVGADGSGSIRQAKVLGRVELPER
ncbi:MAG TPA: DUF4097 family beta strand repeat-containing protein [Povalibacter sp.]|uniref:GIN domain-containing protein n=1 Tax=Povalibacter sp. TaxID=1962978 RepID=UPI002BC89C55|nr:DUF2807 domain-containing protein [Povalibacter sp.]HMN45465.1 DUF4097 family beta strand repeat-containing protein [Povalibacter sp.]